MRTLRRSLRTWTVTGLSPLLALVIFACQRMSVAGADRWAPRLGALLRGDKRSVILTRLAAVLGAERLPQVDEDAFWAAHLRYVGLTVIESFRVGALSRAQLREHFELEGEAYLRRALEGGRGILLLLPHLGHIGAATIALGARGYDVTVAGNGMDITIGDDAIPLLYLERRVVRLFAHGGVRRLTLARRLPFHGAEIFKRNAVLALFVDFTVTQRHNERFRFGAAELAGNIGPAVLGLRNKPAVLYASARPIPGSPGRHLVSLQPVAFVPTGHIRVDAHALTQVAVDLAATDLLERPEQWWSWDWARVEPSAPAGVPVPSPSEAEVVAT